MKQRKSILVCGEGVVGNLIINTFSKSNNLDIYIYDKYKYQNKGNKIFIKEFKTGKVIPYKEGLVEFDFCFICVPTDNIEDACDVSNVEECINRFGAEVYVIKSTVPVGATNSLLSKTYKNIIFSPEFSGGTQHVLKDENFVILGGETLSCERVSQLYYEIFNASFKVIYCSSKEAEMCKYFVNTYLAAKVVFCSFFKLACQDKDISYDKMRQLFLLDPRINPSHTIVYDDLGYDSHCFNKDLPALCNMGFQEEFSNFIEGIIQSNDILKKFN